MVRDPILTRRRLLLGAAAGLAGALVPGPARAVPRVTRAFKNLLLIVCSGERSWDRLPAHLAVPARERLLRNSVSFRNCMAASPTRVPALAALLTGQHGPTTGITEVGGYASIGAAFSEPHPTLATIMRNGGWHTAYFGDWPISRLCGPRDRSDLLDHYGYSWTSLPPVGTAAGIADRLSTRSVAGWLGSRATSLTQPWMATVHLEGARCAATTGDNVDQSTGRLLASVYERDIVSSDARLGELLDALEDSGQESNTVVIYTSDCAVALADDARRPHSASAYQETINVPLLVNHPDGKGAVETTALASAVDIAPTALMALNVPQRMREPTAGYSLLRNLFSPAAKTARDRPDRGALLTHSGLGATSRGLADSASAVLRSAIGEERSSYRAIVDRRYKLVRRFAPTEHHTPGKLADLIKRNDLELYDLANDPDELRNLSNEATVDRRLLARLNSALGRLISEELGEDGGSYLPGPDFLWRD